jgi:hypothetical protein
VYESRGVEWNDDYSAVSVTYWTPWGKQRRTSDCVGAGIQTRYFPNTKARGSKSETFLLYKDAHRGPAARRVIGCWMEPNQDLRVRTTVIKSHSGRLWKPPRGENAAEAWSWQFSSVTVNTVSHPLTSGHGAWTQGLTAYLHCFYVHLWMHGVESFFKSESRSTGQGIPRLLWNPKCIAAKPDPTGPYLPVLFLLTSILTLLHKPKTPDWSIIFTLPSQNFTSNSPAPSARYMPCPSQPPSFYHANNIWWRAQTV